MTTDTDVAALMFQCLYTQGKYIGTVRLNLIRLEDVFRLVSLLV